MSTDLLLALAHGLLLSCILLAGLRNRSFTKIELFLVVYLLIWFCLICADYTTSIFSKLNSPRLFVVLTIAYAGAAYPFLRLIAPLRINNQKNFSLPCIWPKSFQAVLASFFFWTWLTGLFCNLLIAIRIPPDNPDAVAYRIPKVFFYIGHGSLSHFATGVDPRMLYYPLNGVLLESFIVYHRLGPYAFNLVCTLSWVIITFGTYQICRNLGIGELGSRGTAWIVSFTPNVLAQATSSNDEIIAAAPILVGILLALRWLQSRHISHLVLAAIGIGIGCGTKLHFIFFWPLGAFLAAATVLILYKCKDRWNVARPFVIPAFSALIIISIISLPFAIYNLISSGHLIDESLAAEISNHPFQLGVGLQNLGLYISQLIISPVLDLNLAGADARRTAYSTLNIFSNQHLFGWVRQDANYMGCGYHFEGIWSFYSYYLSEESLFLGLTPILFVIAPCFIASIPKPDRYVLGIFLSSFWVYIITYSLATKYIETTGIYFAYATMVAGPGLAAIWFPLNNSFGNRVQIIAIGLILITHVVADVNILRFNVMRNVREALKFQPSMRSQTDTVGRLKQDLLSTGRIHFVFTHWEVPFYWLIQVNPGATYSVGNTPLTEDPKILNVFSYESAPLWGYVPLKVYDPGQGGLTYLGLYHSSYGSESAFAEGDNIEKRHPADTGFIILHPKVIKSASGFTVSIASTADGLSPDAKGTYRYALLSKGKVLIQTGWSNEINAELLVAQPDPDDCVLDVHVALDGRKGISEFKIPLSGTEPLLSSRP